MIWLVTTHFQILDVDCFLRSLSVAICHANYATPIVCVGYMYVACSYMQAGLGKAGSLVFFLFLVDPLCNITHLSITGSPLNENYWIISYTVDIDQLGRVCAFDTVTFTLTKLEVLQSNLSGILMKMTNILSPLWNLSYEV